MSCLAFCVGLQCLTIGAGDGGAYPECHVAQYPLNMGKKKASLIVSLCNILNSYLLRLRLETHLLCKSMRKEMFVMTPLHYKDSVPGSMFSPSSRTSSPLLPGRTWTKCREVWIDHLKMMCSRPQTRPVRHWRSS